MMINFRLLHLIFRDRFISYNYTKFLFLISFCFLCFEVNSLRASYLDTEDIILDLKEREIEISGSLRCLVCQNQSIDESNAALAKDLRIVIRKKVIEGTSDTEIYNFLTERYGDFILLKPPFKLSTLPLWFLPFFFLLIGIFIIFYHNKKSRTK